MIMNQLSGGTLNETSKEKKSTQPSWLRAGFDLELTDSEAEPEQDRLQYRSEIETRAMSQGQFKGFLDGLEMNSTSQAQTKMQEKELMEKYMPNISKFDKSQMIAMTGHDRPTCFVSKIITN